MKPGTDPGRPTNPRPKGAPRPKPRPNPRPTKLTGLHAAYPRRLSALLQALILAVLVATSLPYGL
ncbi:hypothetical protein EDC02_5903 [Micromonospora sp. Llam0]|nr:hypothetical protein EDC02_5903 [Micromonospora sp. Llam0]